MADRTDWVSTGEARVASIQLEPGEASPWHWHSSILERVVCLSGVIEVQYQNPDSAKVLEPGATVEIEARRAHRLVNTQSSASTYLLVQSGKYDFIPLEPSQAGNVPLD